MLLDDEAHYFMIITLSQNLEHCWHVMIIMTESKFLHGDSSSPVSVDPCHKIYAEVVDGAIMTRTRLVSILIPHFC